MHFFNISIDRKQVFHHVIVTCSFSCLRFRALSAVLPPFCHSNLTNGMGEPALASGYPGTSSKRPPPPEDDGRCHRDQKRLRAEFGYQQPFACPLYAAFPHRYTRDTLCASRGWVEIPRLKEHIYRCHYQTSCERCLETFKQEKDLVAHRRQSTSCPRKDNSCRDPVAQGIGQDKMSMLKSRKRSSCQTPEDKWGEIWNILFPGVKPPETPCKLMCTVVPSALC